MFGKKTRKMGSWLVASCLMFGGLGVASAERSGQQEYHRGAMYQQQQEAKTIQGRVVAMKSVRLRGTQQQNLAALIRTAEGQRRVVDLGPMGRARQLDLDLGDRLVVRGRMAQVGNQRILIANQARVGDRTISIDRSMQRRHFRATQGQHLCPPMEG
jgi:hypothetical protein